MEIFQNYNRKQQNQKRERRNETRKEISVRILHKTWSFGHFWDALHDYECFVRHVPLRLAYRRQAK